MESIPKFTAWQLCAEIRQEYKDKWYTLDGLWCWGCRRFAKSDLNHMRVSNTPEYRGCSLVNHRFEEMGKHHLN